MKACDSMIFSLKRGVVALIALAVVASGCVTGVKAGAKCRSADFGDDGTFVMKCEKGRWVQKATKAQLVELFVALLKSKNAATAPAGTCPSYQFVAKLGPGIGERSSVSGDGRFVAFMKDSFMQPKLIMYDVRARQASASIVTFEVPGLTNVFLSSDASTSLVDGTASSPSFVVDIATGDAVALAARAKGISANGSTLLLADPSGRVLLANGGSPDPVFPFAAATPNPLMSGDASTVLGGSDSTLQVWRAGTLVANPQPFAPTWINRTGIVALGYQAGIPVFGDPASGVLTKLGPLGFGIKETSGIRGSTLVASADGNRVLRTGSEYGILSLFLTDRLTGATIRSTGGIGAIMSASDDLRVVVSDAGLFTCS